MTDGEDAHLDEASLAAFGEVFQQDFLYVLRSERVQIQNPVNGQFNRSLHRIAQLPQRGRRTP